MLADVALVSWAIGAALGLTMLRRWPGAPRLALGHLTVAATGLAAWVGFLLAGRPHWLAWTVFGWLTLVNVLGDMLMLRAWRRRTREPRPKGLRAYLGAARSVLTGGPVRSAHAGLAPVTYVLVLLTALGV